MANRKMLRVLGKDRNQAVIRILVDDQHLKVLPGLGRERGQKLVKFLGPVERC